MKLEDLFKKYFDDEEDYDDNPFEDDDDLDDDDDDDDGDDDGDDYDDDDYDDQDQDDDQEDQDDKKDDKDKDRDRDKDDKDEKDKDDKSEQKENTDDSSKDGDQSSENGKSDAGQEQEAKDNLDKNVDEKDVENKMGEAKEKEANGAEGHSSSDTGAKNPLEDADTSGLDAQGGEAGQGAEGAGKGAGEAGKGGAEGAGKGGAEGAGKGAGEAGKDAAKAGGEVGKDAAKAGGEVGKDAAKVGGEVGKDAAIAGGEGVKDAAVVGGAGGTTAAGGGAAAAAGGGGAAAAGGGAAAAAGGAGSAAGSGGLISAIAATVPWSLIVIAVIIIIIIIIIIISFFQTLPGSILGNLKRTVKEWACDVWANVTEVFGKEDNTRRISKEEVNDLAKYINDMGYDIQTYGFGDIKVKKSDNDYDDSKNTKNNRVDKEVEDDGATDDLQVKSKYLKAYLAADECTYHFQGNSFFSKLFDSGDGQKGLIKVITTGGGLFNGDDDQLRIDRESESIVVYNHSIDIPIVGFFKKLFTGSRSFTWGEIIRYDLNTWIGRYKRPVELFLALHIATMMPDLTYKIATDSKFNTEVDVHFEPIKICLKGNLEDDTAYIKRNGETYTARQIIKDYFSLFEVKKGIFDSKDENAQDKEIWNAWSTDDATSAQELWEIFTKLFEKFDDVESLVQEVWNWFVDWKKITLEDYACALMEDDMVFDDLVDLEENGRRRFYSYFGCGPSTLNLAKYPNVNSQWYTDHPEDVSKKGTLIRGSGKFHMSDMEKMIDIWNTDRAGKQDANGNDYGDAIDLDGEEFEDYDPVGSPEFIVRYLDEGIKLKLKHEPTSDEEKSIVYRAYVLYKFGTEDIMPDDDDWGEGDQGGLDNMLWPFVSDVKNHWYYKDIDFLGTSEENATYRLAKVGYKTIQYKTSEDGMNNDFQMPCALYPNKDRKWDFLVYQVAEPVTEGCNENIKKVFSDKYYRYDGTEQTAKMIANTRAIEEGKSTYYYNGTDCPVEDTEDSKVEKEAVTMPDSPEKALNALAIVKNMHSLSSDYIYRDLKELFVKLEYYTKEEMTEDLKLMMLWPISVGDNKNETFDLIETHDKFGKAIVSYTGAEVLAPMDGTIVACDGGYEIHMDTLNDDDAKLLAFIFQNDFYRINKDALKTMKIRLSGFTLSDDIDLGTKKITVKGETLDGAIVKRGQSIGKVNSAQNLSVMIRKNDETVIEDMTEYMREDHNDKYEEIMRRKMESKDGTLPPIPLRDIFNGTSNGAGDNLSIDGYNNDRTGVTVNDAAKAIYKELKSAGYTDEQIAGTLGNVQHESGVLSNNLENGYESGWQTSDSSYTSRVDAGTWVSTAFDHRNAEGKGYWSSGGQTFVYDRGGYGLCQWTSSGRKQNLKNKADARGVSVSNVDIQAELLREELGSDSIWAGHTTSMNSFRNAGTGEDGVKLATKAFCLGFERPADPEGSMQSRISAALTFYDKIKAGELGSVESAATGNNVEVSGTTLVWPAPNTTKGNTSSRFGYRTHPSGVKEYHHGEDIPGNNGDPILSASNGVICGNGWTNARGWYILVFDESTKTKFVYQHMNSKSSLSVGTQVKAGDRIGSIGNTGDSYGAHLHFEIHVNDSATDSIPWIDGGIAEGTVDPGSYNYISANS